MPNWLDLLPDDLVKMIWKWVFILNYNDSINSIVLLGTRIIRQVFYVPYPFNNIYNDPATSLRLQISFTSKIYKKESYYSNLLKEMCDVNLFYKEKTIIKDNYWKGAFEQYEDLVTKKQRELFLPLYGKPPKKNLYNILAENNYVFPKNEFGETIKLGKDKIFKYMYKSWTRKRIIKEIMSL